MIYIDLPTGGHHGWGICGDNLSAAVASLTPAQRLTRRPDGPLDGPLLQSVGPFLKPDHDGLSATRRVGYVMFENDLMAQRRAVEALGSFDAVATACRWAEDALRAGGLKKVATIPQGVDTHRFNPSRAARRRSRRHFIVFSGGKFEYRKSQDIVAIAFGIFARRHADALLVAAWHNPWIGSAATMGASPHLPFTIGEGEALDEAQRRWLSAAGLTPDQVVLVPAQPNENLAAIYGDSDVGLFPNRCEGATNLVLMEYMACGRPAIATDFAGHRDVISAENGLPLRAWKYAPIAENGIPVACWCEPEIDEVVERLEEAYQDRDRLTALGMRAAHDISQLTWRRAAEAFVRLLGEHPSSAEASR